jgi:hypothetical protein
MTEVVILRPSLRDTLTLVAMGVACTVISMHLIVSGRTDLWFAGVVFGVCTVVFLILLLPNNSYLMLRPEGFTIRSLYCEHTMSWREMQRFGVYRVGLFWSAAYVGFTLTPAAAAQRRVRTRVSRFIIGYEGGLPNNFGMKAEALAALMNAWRDRALATEGKPG